MKPSITHTHGTVDDCNSTTSWTKVVVGSLAATTHTILYDDYFDLTGTCTDANNEYMYVWKSVLALSLSTTLYPKLVVRWKTSVIADGLQAKVKVYYSDASSTEETLGFSAGWKTSTVSLTDSKVISTIQLYADDDPNTVAAGTFHVYYDFVMFCGGVFTFPNCAGGLQFTPASRYATVPMLRRDTDVLQFVGSESARIECSCNLDIGNWKRSGDYVNGEVFLAINHKASTEPFQWLDTGIERFKVILETPKFRREVNGNRTSHMLDLAFKEYSRCSKDTETYLERYGLVP